MSCTCLTCSSQYTLGEGDVETMEVEQLKNLAEILYMSIFIRTENKNVATVDKSEWKVI